MKRNHLEAIIDNSIFRMGNGKADLIEFAFNGLVKRIYLAVFSSKEYIPTWRDDRIEGLEKFFEDKKVLSKIKYVYNHSTNIIFYLKKNKRNSFYLKINIGSGGVLIFEFYKKKIEQDLYNHWVFTSCDFIKY